MVSSFLWALGGTQFIFFMTALGASLVFFFRGKELRFQRALLGFAGGVMTAASVWSLLLPAIEQTEAESGLPAWLPAAAGLVLGAFFILLADALHALRYGLPFKHRAIVSSHCSAGPARAGRGQTILL